jgi:predicted metal-dependent phosphoesterase TrpH
MREKYIDLHIHSYYSDDGEFSPIELVQKCKEQGIKIMAIADHNCVRANFEGQRAALSAGITYIPAIEIDCTFQKVNLHVLGYGIDYQSTEFYLIEKNIQEQSLTASWQRLLLTQELGFRITESDMVRIANNSYWKDQWTGEMFAEVLLSKPEYEDHPLLRPYRLDGSRAENPYVNFYWDYYSQGKPCYTEMIYPSLEEAVRIIRDNGGVAVLAHPGNSLHGMYELFDEIIKTGIQGVEVFSSYHDKETIKNFLDKGKKHNLLITCGSDFHGKTKPAIELGETQCTIDEYEIENQLKEMNLIW